MPNLFGNKDPAVNIQRDCYAMTTTVDGNHAEVIMYGDIVESIPRHWWTGEPLEGNYIVLDEFLNDLEQLKAAKRITVRIHSCGGEAFASITIHNRLRELRSKVTVIVDGVAMSGGSLIMCAANKVKVNPSSLIMIHKCLRFMYGGYNADELRKIATANDAADKAQVAIYARKTGIADGDLLSMMAEDTYMTGREAIEKGFADELTEGEPVQIVASADRHTLFVNGKERRLPFPIPGLPETIPTVNPETAVVAPVSTNTNQPAPTGGTEGGTTMARTLEELRSENPELANALMAEAQAAVSSEIGTNGSVVAERARLREIDEVSALFDDETVREAKYGANTCTAQEMAYRAAQKAVKEGKNFMSALTEDAKVSGAQDVEAAPGEDEGDGGKDETIDNARAQVKALLGKEKEA